MIPAQRQKKILSLLTAKNIISINDLANEIGVSHMTIRRDIQKLEDSGKIISVFGGVKLLEHINHEPTHSDKIFIAQEQKKAIANCAYNYIQPNSTIFLDAGTTCLALAKNISLRDDLLVVTNDFAIADYLIRESSLKIIHTGGIINRQNFSAVGQLAAEFLQKISIDTAFVSTSSWDSKGFTTPDENKIAVKKAILKASHKNILLTDSLKYGKVATFWISELNEFDLIITDEYLSETIANNITKQINISVIRSKIDNIF